MSNSKRPRRKRTGDDSPTLATGVATGGLGTGANLDDTQVLRTTGLAELEGAEPDMEPELDEPIVESVKPAPAPAPVRPVITRRSDGSGGRRARGLAGLLAAALVVLAGAAVLVTRDDGTLGVGTVPSVGAASTAEPSAEGADRDGKGRCKGNGKGKGSCSGGGGD